MSDVPYNPLDTKNLGASVAEALLEKTPQPLAKLERFNGAGIYAIYYVGSLPMYRRMADANCDERWRWPIYIGKAVPSGSRKALSSRGSGRWLHSRLREHAESIEAARNLDLADFYCRFLVVEDIWIPLGESLLISRFTPIWNRLVEGFGNHDPGAGRYQGLRPVWDVLHPGRVWAQKCAARPETSEEIEARVEKYLLTELAPPEHPRLLLGSPGFDEAEVAFIDDEGDE